MAAQSLSVLPISTAFSPSASRISAPPSLAPYKSESLGNSFLENVELRCTNCRPLLHRKRSSMATVFFMQLPNAQPERAPVDKIPKWSARAIKAFGMAELEARKLKYPTTGTEALLMGILVEGTSFAAKFLRANGITLFKLREETIKLLGKADMYYFSPEHPPLTEPAQHALDWAIDQKIKSGFTTNDTVSLYF